MRRRVEDRDAAKGSNEHKCNISVSCRKVKLYSGEWAAILAKQMNLFYCKMRNDKTLRNSSASQQEAEIASEEPHVCSAKTQQKKNLKMTEKVPLMPVFSFIRLTVFNAYLLFEYC